MLHIRYLSWYHSPLTPFSSSQSCLKNKILTTLRTIFWICNISPLYPQLLSHFANFIKITLLGKPFLIPPGRWLPRPLTWSFDRFLQQIFEYLLQLCVPMPISPKQCLILVQQSSVSVNVKNRWMKKKNFSWKDYQRMM